MSAQGVALEPPAAALKAFMEALAAGDLQGLSLHLCRDACFITRDATTIHGRERIVALLAQLESSGLRVSPRSMQAIPFADFALASARWTIRVPAHPQPLLQTTEATLALARRESRWKLLLIAPWGWP